MKTASSFKSALATSGFKVHKGKNKEIVASKFHPSVQSVRIVCNSGIEAATGTRKVPVNFKAVFINKQKQWREIASTADFPATVKDFANNLRQINEAVLNVPSCKHCKAKKFTSKKGNLVCSNACWSTWSGKKSAKKTSKKPATRTPRPRAQKAAPVSKPKKAVRYDLQCGDLVTFSIDSNDWFGIVSEINDYIVRVNWSKTPATNAKKQSVLKNEVPATEHHLHLIKLNN